jgi:predicted N-acetyltransferase YhbS
MDMDACTAYSIRRMEKKDMAQSVALTDLMDWGLTEEDFAFNIGLEPGGCFVAVSEGERVVGVITSVAYGKVGWVGNVIVHPRRRDSGIGAALVSHALDHLTMRGVVTTGLYGYRNVVHFYERLGFRVSRPFSWMSCKTVSWMGEAAPSAEPTDIQAIVELDERCFGAPRQRLLRSLLASPFAVTRVALDQGKLISYVAATKFEETVEIGPWASVKGREQEGLQLFRSLGEELRGLEAHVGVPSDRPDLTRFLSDIGFAEEFPVNRMYHGQPLPDNRCTLAMESLERG